MINLTPLSRIYLSCIDRQTMWAAHHAEKVQRKVLRSLLRDAQGCNTMNRFKNLGLKVASYEEFRKIMPMTDYEDYRESVMKMIDGAKGVLCRKAVANYAQSSGTSGGKSKYIPLPERSLKRCHYAGATKAVARYLSLYPQSRMFGGKGLILGGSFANELHAPLGVKVGDLSATLIDRITPFAEHFRVPSKKTALLADWHEKLPRIVAETLGADVTNLSGVPSWFLTVIMQVMQESGASELHEVWPNLEVFFHGGISFKPYRAQYDRLIDPSRMRYFETYNASEGFFAVQAGREPGDMLLLTDIDVFYEFVPLNKMSGSDVNPDDIIPLWETEVGEEYAMLISSSNGLWRYAIGDTVKITGKNPYTIVITGRTHSYINAFGEELMVCNADAALEKTCSAMGAHVTDYTVAPVYACDHSRGRHQWFVAFSTPPADLAAFAALLDKNLQQENSDYQAKRSGDIFLDPLELIDVNQSLFELWLAKTGKLGGQRKLPRLRNDRLVADALLELNQTSTKESK